jgi:hypothetical protein
VLQGAARVLIVGTNDKDTPTRTPALTATEARIDRSPTSVISDCRREATTRLRKALGDQQLQQRRAEGETLGLDKAVSVALSLIEKTSRARSQS